MRCRVVLSVLLALCFALPARAEDVEAPSATSAATEAATPGTTIPKGGTGDLLIAPTRVILAGRTRSAEIILKNHGSGTTTYRIQLIDLNVNEQGEYEPAEHYAKSAMDMIRFAPRQVTLAPGATQKVKILVRKPQGLADGEYRTHLKFQALPGSDAGKDVEAIAVNDKVSVKLIPIVGISIPVIVQQGALSKTIDMQAKHEGKDAAIELKRSGSASALGDIVIKAGEDVLANANATVLYPASHKTIRIPLPDSAAGKKLTAEYTELQDDKKIIATTQF